MAWALDAMLFLGAALIVAGIGMIHAPSGVIASGVAVILFVAGVARGVAGGRSKRKPE